MDIGATGKYQIYTKGEQRGGMIEEIAQEPARTGSSTSTSKPIDAASVWIASPAARS